MEKVNHDTSADTPAASVGATESGRNCGNCACAVSVKHPHLVNTVQLLCRRNGAMMVQQRTPEGILTSLTYAPTQAELVCFDGWRAVGTPPGIAGQ